MPDSRPHPLFGRIFLPVRYSNAILTVGSCFESRAIQNMRPSNQLHRLSRPEPRVYRAIERFIWHWITLDLCPNDPILTG